MTVRGTESTREPKDVFLNVRFDRSTHRKLVSLAQRRERTLAAEVRMAVKRHLEDEAKESS